MLGVTRGKEWAGTWESTEERSVHVGCNQRKGVGTWESTGERNGHVGSHHKKGVGMLGVTRGKEWTRRESTEERSGHAHRESTEERSGRVGSQDEFNIFTSPPALWVKGIIN